jgi:hypothetical protein
VPTGATRPNDDLSRRRPTMLTEVCETCRLAPFAWQEGRRLWILDGRASDWVLAELLFEPESCRYLEVRRSSYRWPREAAGALLSRTFAGGQRQAEQAARGLLEWAERWERAL